MTHYGKETLKTQYQKLPQALKEAIVSVEVADKMFELGKKYGLTIEKTGFLAEETGYVMLGLLKPSEFVGEIAKRLEIDGDKAKKIAAEVNHQIFFPIREMLKSAHQVEITYEKLEKQESGIRNQSASWRTGIRDETREIKPAAPPAAPAPKMPLPKDVMPMSALKNENQELVRQLADRSQGDETITTTASPTPKSAVEPKAPELPEIMGGIFFAGPADEKEEATLRQAQGKTPPPQEPEAPRREVKPPIDLRNTEQPPLTPPSPQPPLPPPPAGGLVEPSKPPEKKSPYSGIDPYKEPIE